VLLFSSTLFAKSYTLNELQKFPKSNAKDFYIYRYLEKTISKNEAKILYKEVNRLSPKLYKRFLPYIDELKRKNHCQKLKPKYLTGVSQDCVSYALPLYKAIQLEPNYLTTLASSLNSNAPKMAQKYKVVAKRDFNILLDQKPDILLSIFNNVGSNFRKRYYNHKFSKQLLPSLVKEKSFNTTIEKIVREDLANLQKSIVNINSKDLNANSNFLLGLNAIKYGQLELALKYLQISEKKAYFTFEKDKALFWQYLLTKNNSILDKLIDSHEINIYSLQAYELKGKFPKNIVYDLKTYQKKAPFNIRDPFAWLKFQKKIKSKKFNSFKDKKAYLLKLTSYESKPHIAKLLYNYKAKTEYFLTPYSKYLKNISTKRKVLIYSLARQESRFIPTDISSSYALGMMQFMPFLAKDIAKKFKLTNFEYEDMFDPKTAYDFANYHLDFLEKNLDHPLFIAYAYNGGIGFTKRKILNKGYFKAGSYEPFWSMEMIPNAQARKYGKRVLANYVIYSKHLGLDTSLKSLLNTLKQ
jgi:soluble lytic murein transglycosylase